jgi:succinate dehydrogenase (ubiquinone) flavoprotein subunit
LNHLDPKVLHERLPGIAETAKIFANVDVTREPAPVVPTVHYNMGGVPTNYKTEVTKLDKNGKEVLVPGLMACGEVAVASVHGANRLGANSLLDLVVFGRAAALQTKELYKPGQTQPELPKNAGEESIAKIEALRTGKGTIETANIRKAMQRTMQRNASVYRIEKTLQEGCDRIDETYQQFHQVKINDKGLVWNTDLIETLELENLLRNF